MLMTNSIYGGRHFTVYAIDRENGDPTIRRADGEFVRVPRFLVTSPTERCDKCQRPLEFRDATKTVDRNRAVCPDMEHHVYIEFWRASRRPGLNRGQRRALARKADGWLSRHLEVKRGRGSASSASDAGSIS